MNIAVFGGASAKPGEETYNEALRLGAMLANLGHTMMTGGYVGVMEAASRGANEAGGHVVGVTCAQIERWRNSKANAWLKEERHFETLRERMYALIDGCDAAVVMPGGIGTLCELAVTWNEQVINGKNSRPLILVGNEWNKVISQFIESLGCYLSVKDRDLIQIVPDVDTAVEIIKMQTNTNDSRDYQWPTKN